MQNKLAAFLLASRRRPFYIQGHVNEDRRAQTRFKSWFPLSFVNIYDLFKFFLQEQEAKGHLVLFQKQLGKKNKKFKLLW